MKETGVLYLMPWLIVGGAENQVVQTLRFIDRRRFRPVVCCIREPGILFKEIQELGITSYCLDMRPKYGVSTVQALGRILEIIRREKIQILQAMEFNARVLGAAAAKLGRVPVNLAAEHYTGEWREPTFKRIVKRLTVPFVDRIICVAEAQKKYLIEDRRIPANKMEVIYNGIDPSIFNPRTRAKIKKSDFGIPEESPVAGIVAALRPEKAHHVFLEAARRVVDQIEDPYFLIVGDGERRGELEDLSKTLGIEKRTVFTGVRKDVPDMLRLMDVVVLSSYPVVETFPVSLLEAMAMKKPVVSTNVSGIPEMVEEGKNGFLVPVGDPGALARAVSGILEDKRMAKKMGAAGRKLVEERFTIQHTVNGLEELYLRLLESKTKSKTGSRFRKSGTSATSERKITILHLTHGSTYSGGEHALYLLYKYIDREKFDPIVLCLEDGLLRQRLMELGLKVYCMNSPAKMPIHLLPLIMRVAREENADLIINQTTRTTLIGRLASLLTGKPNITIIQAPILRDTNTSRLRWENYVIERLTGFLSDRHIVVNNALREEMIGWRRDPRRIKTIYNSVDPEYLEYEPEGTIFRDELGIRKDSPVAGMIASFRPRKGAEYLIRAMPAVLEKFPDALLLMIGHGEWVKGKDYIEELKTLTNSLGTGKSVIFTGFRSDIPRIVSELDTMILPSLYGEGSSLTVLEAMCLGRPVIASATEGNVELIDDGITGRLVPPADSKALSRAIISIFSDRERAKAMGEAAKQKAINEFLADRMAGRYVDLFNEVLGTDNSTQAL